MGAPLTAPKVSAAALVWRATAFTESDTSTTAVLPAAGIVTFAVYGPTARPVGSTPTTSVDGAVPLVLPRTTQLWFADAVQLSPLDPASETVLAAGAVDPITEVKASDGGVALSAFVTV